MATITYYAWTEGATVIYTLNNPPSVGENVYSDTSGTVFGTVRSADSSEIILSGSPRFFERDASKDVTVSTDPDNIADAIAAAQGRVADCYTAISNKGGTIPATQNLANMPTAIDSIPSGYTELPSYQVSNGVVSRRSGALTGNTFSGITSVDDSGFSYAFYGCTGLTGNLDLSSLTTVGDSGLYYAFLSCTSLTSVNLSSLISVGLQGFMYAFCVCIGLTSVDLSSLTSVSDNGFYGAFLSCTSLTSVNLSSLTTIGYVGLNSAFRDCTGLTSVNLSSLTSVGGYGLQNAFRGCTGLTDIYFNSLTTTTFGSSQDQFMGMLTGTGTSVTHTLHFPSNLETTIQGLYEYPTFGGTSGYVVLSFDLPATS